MNKIHAKKIEYKTFKINPNPPKNLTKKTNAKNEQNPPKKRTKKLETNPK